MKLSCLSLLICTCLLAASGNCWPQTTMVPWLTRAADNSRSGWNQNETQLSQASVTTKELSGRRSFR